jgi:hypothetical protein
VQVAPTDGETKQLRAWLLGTGASCEQLSPPEQVLAVLAGIPDLAAKIEALTFRAQWGPLCSDAQAALALLQKACVEVGAQC